MAHNTLLINHIGDTARYQTQNGGGAITLPHCTICVAQQNEGQMMLLRKLLVRLPCISTNPDHFGARIFEYLVTIAKGACLDCTAVSVVLWIKVHNHILLPGKIAQPHLLP